MRTCTCCIAGLLLLLTSYTNAQWEQRGTGMDVMVATAIDAVDSSTAVAAKYYHVYKTTDGGLSWKKIDTVGLAGTQPSHVSIVDPLHIWITTFSGEIHATTDGGATWAVQFKDSTLCPFMDYIKMFTVNTGIAMGDGLTDAGPAVFLKTTDGGTHWVSQNDSAFGGWSSLWHNVCFLSPDVGYFYQGGVTPRSLWKTTNAGRSWTMLNAPAVPNGVHVSFANEQIGMLSQSNGSRLWRTVNGGATWDSIPSADLDLADIEFIKGDPSKVWLASFDIWSSVDTGKTWTSNFKYFIRDIVFTDQKTGWALGTFPLRTTTGGLTSAPISDANIPTKPDLLQNYPNPFNPNSDIRFEISELSQVKLAVYDLLGREVTVLVNEQQNPGSYTVRFDGSGLSSGVYLCRLTAGQYVETRKMLLIR